MKKVMMVLLFFLHFHVFGKDPIVAVCAIFKNEAEWFKEWIEFHKLQGVTHFYLYNNNSTDDYLKVLRSYIDNNEVTLIDWEYTFKPGNADDWIKIQSQAYQHCIDNFKNDANWIAFIDADEFLFCVDGTQLPKFLIKYQNYGGVFVNWRLFGTSYVKSVPKGRLMIETLIRCSQKDLARNRRVKIIVQPKLVKKCSSPHYFYYKNGYFDVSEYYKKKRSYSSPVISHDKICLNHYWTRTEDYFDKRKKASRNNRRKYETYNVLQQMADQYNEKVDKTILQFVPALRKQMKLD